MKQPVKQILSFLMAVCLIVGLFPILPAAEEVQPEVQFVAQQLTLGDDLTMRFVVNVDESILQTAKINITVAGSQTAWDVKSLTPESDGNYQVSVHLAAAQMTDAITLSVTNGDTVLKQKDYSIQSYARFLLEGSYSTETKQLVRQMLSYGAKAQKYFNYRTENLADAGYEITPNVQVPAVTDDLTKDGAVEGIAYYGASLLFVNKITVRYYFTAPDGVANYIFRVGDVKYDAVEKDGKYYVDVPGINPQNIGKKVSLTVSDTEGASLTVGYSPMMYITRMYNRDTTGTALKELLQAMYDYHLEALAFTGVSGGDIQPAAWYYCNDFEGQTVIAGDKVYNIPDDNGKNFVNNNDLFKTVVLPDGNTVLELIAEGSATNYLSIPGAPEQLTIRFRVRLAEGASFSGRVLELRYRDGKKPFAAFVDGNLDMSTSTNNNAYTHRTALSALWTEVEMTIDGVAGKISYTVNGASGEMTVSPVTLTQLDFYSHTTHSGIYLDDLRIYKGAETTSVLADINWDDQDNHDDIRPDGVKVSLYNGDILFKTAEVTADTDWQYTFSQIPKYNHAGVENEYTVMVETGNLPDGYTASVNGNTVTLNHTPTITWYYNNSFAGQIVTAGDKVYNIPDKNGNNFVNNNDLFKTVVLSDGNTVLELISEGSATSYLSIPDAPAVLTVQFRVRLAEETTSYSGRILELRYRDGKKPFAAFVDGNLDMNTSTKNDNYYQRTALSTQWTEVEMTIDAVYGKIFYTVNGVSGEMAISPVTLTQLDFYSHSAHSGIYLDDFKVYLDENRIPKQETVDVTGSVSWDDSDDHDEIRPESVTVNLYHGNSLVDSNVVNADAGWQFAFTELPKHDGNGKEIAYTVQVDEVPVGYTANVVDAVITLSHTPTITWYYKHDFEGQTVTAGDKVYNISDANGKNLVNNNDLFKTVVLPDGNTVLELISEGSATSYLSIPNAPVVLTVQFRVRLAEDYAFSGRVLELRYRDGKKPFAAFVDGNLDMSTSTKNDNYYHRTALSTQWTEVEMTIDAVYGKISYTVNGISGNMKMDPATLTQLDFYSHTVHSGIYLDDFKVYLDENRIPEPEKTEVTGSITWSDNNNYDAIRPDSVTVNLYYGDALQGSVEVKADSLWQFNFSELLKYDINGTEIPYTVTVDAIPDGYNVSVDGFTITLTHTIELPNTNKPNGQVTAFFYNDYDGDKVDFDTGATIMQNDHIMETVTNNGNSYMRVEMTDPLATATYQADFVNNKAVNNFIVHFKLSTDSKAPAGSFLEYRYSANASQKLFTIVDYSRLGGILKYDGSLSIGGEVYNQHLIQKGQWLEMDLVFDLTQTNQDTCTFYVGGSRLTTLSLPKHGADYLISYMRFTFSGAADHVGKTLLIDDFMIYEGSSILTVDQVNSPGYIYWIKPHAIRDTAMELPEIQNLGVNTVAVAAGSNQAYINGSLVALSVPAQSSGNDVLVPGDFLMQHLGANGLDGSTLYGISAYAGGKNVLSDSRGMIVLTEDTTLDAQQDVKLLTMLYGYLKTGKLIDNYAAAPIFTQGVIDRAVKEYDAPWPQTDGHTYAATQSANALYYLVLAAYMDPDMTATDGTNVADEAAARIKKLVSGGREPWASVGCYWGHGVVSSALLLAKNTPAIWNQMSQEDVKRIDLLMECMAIAANWGYNSNNDYLTGFDLHGGYGKNYNPNFKNAYFTCYMSAAMYFGPEELDAIFLAFDYDSYISRLREVGFTNILYSWTTEDIFGISIGQYMQNGGNVILNGGLSGSVANGAAGSGVGVAVPFTYKDLQNGYVYDSSELVSMFIDTVGYTYSWEVTSGNQAPGSEHYSYILSGAKSPWEGQMGMMREFASSDSGPRSKVDYTYLSAMNIAALYANLKLLGYWDYDTQSAAIAQKMLEMDNRIYVGTEDLFFKMQEGYLGHSQKTPIEEYEWQLNQTLGACYVKDIFMNFHFMKHDAVNMQTKEQPYVLAVPAEPKNGVTEPSGEAIVSVGRTTAQRFVTDFYAPIDPGMAYSSGTLSFDIVLDDYLMGTKYHAVIAIDKKYEGKNLGGSPMLIQLKDGQFAAMNQSAYEPMGITFGENYRFRVEITFDCASRKYSGTITQTWPETAAPITASFTDFGFQSSIGTMSYVDSFMVISSEAHDSLWLENVNLRNGETSPLGDTAVMVDVKVSNDWGSVPADKQLSQIPVYLTADGRQSVRGVMLTTADGWAEKAFRDLALQINGCQLNWGVATDAAIDGYTCQIVKIEDNSYQLQWTAIS